MPGLLRRWGMSWGGWFDNRHGEWWLLAQLALIAAHLIPSWPRHSDPASPWPMGLVILGGVLVVGGLGLAAQAFWQLGPSLSPLPEPMPGAPLVTTGAYSRCRHPLYQAVLICSLGVSLALGSGMHLVLFVALVALLGGKARREERSLDKAHPDYVAYRSATPAIIPGLPWLDWRGQ